eukprot:TRINITY_DN70608_c0_g1_i1.p1 TRINITY_DN70608_c0_g1~~TRINITY_DN70608_c0_g1_i1.p1  ORF type:complete len:564 (+),score=156.08 TRINITY_DN70608_c0_g1_i1:131-1693(+)
MHPEHEWGGVWWLRAGLRVFIAGAITGLVSSVCLYGFVTAAILARAGANLPGGAVALRKETPREAEVSAVLRRIGLVEYVAAVVHRGGYERADDVRRAGRSELERLGMKPGHAMRLWAALAPPASGAADARPAASAGVGRPEAVAGIGPDGVPGLYSPWLARKDYEWARDPRPAFAHHPVFASFAAAAGKKSPLRPSTDPDVLTDFLGVRTRKEYDCNVTSMYFMFHLSRSIPCQEHDKAVRGEEWHPAKALWPIADEEYFEYVDVLQTVSRAVRERRGFTMFELGARYGTWVARAAVAYRVLALAAGLWPAQAKVIGVEADRVCWGWMKDHYAANNVTKGEAVWGFLDLVEGQLRQVERSFSGHRHTYTEGKDRTPTMTLQSLMRKYNFIDLIDMDVQGYEYSLMSDRRAMAAISDKVAYLHIGTHVNRPSEKLLISALTRNGWCVLFYFPGTFSKQIMKQKWKYTPYGLMKFNDGVLFLENRKYAVPPGRPCHHDFEREVITSGYWDPRALRELPAGG